MQRPCLGLFDCLVDRHLNPIAKRVFGNENNVESSISNENAICKSSNLMLATVITIAFHGVWMRVLWL